jgi:phage head maturation protease
MEPARMRLYGELTKIEDQPDGTLKVYGVASTGARDDAGEIVSPEAMKAALPDYARYPALREMHRPSAAGRTLEATVDEDGATRIVAHVVDPVAIAKVKSRTYSGFSIGGKVLARDAGDASVITKIKLSEISLVDRPANPEAVIDLWKADDLAAPSNGTVKARAAEMARAAGRAGAWKDYVAKARAALTAEASAPDPNAASDDADEPGDGSDQEAGAGGGDPNGEADDASDAGAEAPQGDGPAGAASLIAELANLGPASLQAVHDALAALGATCNSDNCASLDKGVSADDLAKLNGGALAEAVLAKALPRVEALERRLEAQGALLERIAREPAAPRTAASPYARAIGKAEDADPAAETGGDLTPGEAQKVFAALTPDERAFLLMKASLRQPIPLP